MELKKRQLVREHPLERDALIDVEMPLGVQAYFPLGALAAWRRVRPAGVTVSVSQMRQAEGSLVR